MPVHPGDGGHGAHDSCLVVSCREKQPTRTRQSRALRRRIKTSLFVMASNRANRVLSLHESDGNRFSFLRLAHCVSRPRPSTTTNGHMDRARNATHWRETGILEKLRQRPPTLAMNVVAAMTRPAVAPGPSIYRDRQLAAGTAITRIPSRRGVTRVRTVCASTKRTATLPLEHTNTSVPTA